MRNLSFAIVLLIMIAAGVAAGQTEKSAPPASTSPAPEFSLPQNRPRILVVPPGLMDKLKARLPINDNLCYTMNTFVFTRTGPGDATRLIAHRDCTRASLFKLKKSPQAAPRHQRTK